MDLTLILLLGALALVYFAWRAARRETQRVLAARQQQIERGTSSLEPAETAAGRGFVIVLPDGHRSDEYETDWAHDGLEVITLEAFPATPEASTAASFTPGSAVELIPEDDGSIWIWDRGMTVRAGRVPAALVTDITARDEANEIGDAVVLWERLEGGRRSGLDVLLVHRDTPVE
jgi:hypothetical protein